MKWSVKPEYKIGCGSVLVALVLLQSGCSYRPETTRQIPEHWPQTVAQKQQLTAWKLTGRLGIQTENEGGSLDLFWNQQGGHYKVRLIAALGQGTILIQGGAGGVMLKTAEGEVYADSADELLASSLGVPVPILGLRAWLRGIPTEDLPVRKQSWNDQGQLHRLVQGGWNIEMSEYKKVETQTLPHAFYLSREDRPELAIRLLIRQWTLLDSEAV
ncbi:MAG: lipoprotein insertase outer membrane protein LolB [Gammaproteobacteria bacterium]|jgi:outer membrane lipoprotein LolB|nr:lipoprotein insertase outer membrane protein LolB [Gammaproteobacteria bacterium]